MRAAGPHPAELLQGGPAEEEWAVLGVSLWQTFLGLSRARHQVPAGMLDIRRRRRGPVEADKELAASLRALSDVKSFKSRVGRARGMPPIAGSEQPAARTQGQPRTMCSPVPWRSHSWNQPYLTPTSWKPRRATSQSNPERGAWPPLRAARRAWRWTVRRARPANASSAARPSAGPRTWWRTGAHTRARSPTPARPAGRASATTRHRSSTSTSTQARSPTPSASPAAQTWSPTRAPTGAPSRASASSASSASRRARPWSPTSAPTPRSSPPLPRAR